RLGADGAVLAAADLLRSLGGLCCRRHRLVDLRLARPLDTAEHVGPHMSLTKAPAVRQAIVANLGFLVMVTIWGAMFPALERILQTWDVFSATAGRHTLAVIALLIVLSVRERCIPVHRKLPWIRLLLLGFFGMSVTSLLTTLAVHFSSGVSAAITSATNPITSAVIARLLHRVPLLPG